ncbi:MAG: hypothetical protein IPN29_15165 [Saprospiraceae bacterium]|nr:hypothetical protein [Saprospiraceae bacterium]
MNKMFNSNTGMALWITSFAIISRLIPHPYNFSPFGAIALFGAAFYGHKWMAIALPCLTAWISGVILNNIIYTNLFKEFTWFDHNIFWQSLAYIATTLIGFILFNSGTSWTRIVAGALSSSILFFVLTNFGYWYSGLFYPMTFTGLITCYLSAVPFVQSTLLGDLVYSLAMFGAYGYIRSSIMVKQTVK